MLVGQLIEHGQVVVARIEPVGLAVFQGPPQFARRSRIGPGRTKRALRIERVDELRMRDARAVNLNGTGLDQRLDLGLQIRGLRVRQSDRSADQEKERLQVRGCG